MLRLFLPKIYCHGLLFFEIALPLQSVSFKKHLSLFPGWKIPFCTFCPMLYVAKAYYKFMKNAILSKLKK